MISLIWAMDENRLIGKDNRLPWHYKTDLEYFKKITHNQTVLMGDMTYKSLKSYYKNKPLPFKKIYVANHQEYCYRDAICINDLVGFLKTCDEDLFIIGGLMIYLLSLEFATHLYITYVLDRHEGNVFFPIVDMTPFKLKSFQTTDKLIFSVYERTYL
jgi:dihydrofolate reductase